MNENNPYASPTNFLTTSDQLPFPIDPADRKKVDAVIKDAGQFWLAIILCVFCSVIGALIVPFWYLIRLVQWNALAKKYPALTAPDAPVGSVQAKFKSSQWKLIVGLVVGGGIFLWVIGYILILVLVAASGAA